MDKVLDFWFGTICDTDEYFSGRNKIWYGKDDGFDEKVKAFIPLIEQANSGKLDDWAQDPRGRLALIILFDQFPRNSFRDSPQMYAYDQKARALCLEGLDSGADKQLHMIERAFFYLPLEHSELLEDQKKCCLLFEELV